MHHQACMAHLVCCIHCQHSACVSMDQLQDIPKVHVLVLPGCAELHRS